jgi:hypothetical protein
VSDEVSQADIEILFVQLSELRQHYKDRSKELSEFMNGPLKTIASHWDVTLPAMKSFVRGEQMDISKIGTLNEPPGTDLAIPLSCFPCIHRPAILAFSQNISNDSMEAGWSLTSTKFRQGCKAATALFWGMIVRRPMAWLHAKRLTESDFLSIFRKTRRFVREYQEALNHLRTADREASDDLNEARVQAKLPDYVKKGAPFKEKDKKHQNTGPPLNHDDEAASRTILKTARKCKKRSTKLRNTTTSDASDSDQSASDDEDCGGDSDQSDEDDNLHREDGEEQADSVASADEQESGVGPGDPEPHSDAELPSSNEVRLECQPGMVVEEQTHAQPKSADPVDEGGGKSGDSHSARESEPQKDIDDSSDNDSSVEGDEEALRLSKACFQFETDGDSESDEEELDRPLFPMKSAGLQGRKPGSGNEGEAVSSGGADMPCDDCSWTQYPLNDLDPKKTWDSLKSTTSEKCLQCIYTLRMLQQREWKDSKVTARQKNRRLQVWFFDLL